MKPDTRRKAMPAEERRRVILDAALAVFAEKGFASARMDEIARRAGVAKGTVYLYFPDKESLFTTLVSTDLGPIIEHARGFVQSSGLPSRTLIEMLYATVEQRVLTTEKRNIVRLMLTELSAFPAITEHYYRNLVEPGIAVIRTILERAERRGELRSSAVLQVPQFVFAPIVMSVQWDILFSRFSGFETRAAFAFHLDALFTPVEGETT